MTEWLRAGALGVSMSTLLTLPACYAEVAAPVAPPPARVVVMPARAGFVWIDGHHEWRGGQWVSVAGRYEPVRHGHRWVPGRYRQTARGHLWVHGHWARY
ncbi:MAG: YXWGXW repeat-containing protein [Deltaproteobacteria bacterium]|nr:YXWGXW repeat-containing protein [Deltaproteobacteria bacterium]